MLTKVSDEQSRRDSASVPRLSTAVISNKYESATRRLFLIDYEGTLTPNKTGTGVSIGQPYRIVDTLNELIADPKNIVYVMSGLQPEELDYIFHPVENLGLIAENGCLFREHGPGPKSWRALVDMEDVQNWKKEVKPALKYYKERMNNSHIEERHCSLIFHYGLVEDQAAAIQQAGVCAEQINTSSSKNKHVQAVPVSKALIVEQNNINKVSIAYSFSLVLKALSLFTELPGEAAS